MSASESAAETGTARPVLEVSGLSTVLGKTRVVDDISFTVHAGETLCIVGESGCGKSATALSLMRLIQPSAGRVVAGSVVLDGRSDLLSLSEDTMAKMRGDRIAMIFQEPMTSLNPVYRVGEQISELLLQHRKISRAKAWERTVEMLRLVGIPAPEMRARSYPHQLSGGMRQRVMIAMAFACDPLLIIADEPTTALDVTIQAQILNLMQSMKEDSEAGIVLITHDLGVVAEVAQHVCVMYAGEIVESSATEELFDNPSHPYTQGLLASMPDNVTPASEGGRLHTIKGTVPSLANLPTGCRFQDRCPKVHDRCRAERPQLESLNHEQGHQVRCWLYVN